MVKNDRAKIFICILVLFNLWSPFYFLPYFLYIYLSSMDYVNTLMNLTYLVHLTNFNKYTLLSILFTTFNSKFTDGTMVRSHATKLKTP